MDQKKLVRVVTQPGAFRYLLKGQIGYMSQFFDITLISSEGPDLDFIRNTEKVGVTPIFMSRQITPTKDLIALIKMIIAFIKIRPDIVHSHTPKAGLIAMLAAWLCRVPKRMHTVAGMPLQECTGLKYHLIKFTEKLTYWAATDVMPNSKGLLTFIKDNRLCPPHKLSIIGMGSSNGIDTDFFSPQAAAIHPDLPDLKAKIGYEKPEIRFLFVGRIVRDKGVNELVEAFQIVSKEIPEAKLFFVGLFEEDLNPLFPETMSTLKTHPRIEFIGFQSDVRPAIYLCDCLILPSYREGLPQVLLQASALEKPCITTDIMGCNEIVIEEKTGFIVAPKNVIELAAAIKKMAQNQSRRQQMGIAARVHVQQNYPKQLIWDSLFKRYREPAN